MWRDEQMIYKSKSPTAAQKLTYVQHQILINLKMQMVVILQYKSLLVVMILKCESIFTNLV